MSFENFVDATTIKTKETTWEERDKAIEEGEDKLNNRNIEDYSADKDARFGKIFTRRKSSGTCLEKRKKPSF